MSDTAEQPLMSHITALRQMIMNCLMAVMLLYIPMFFLAEPVIGWLIAWSNPPELAKLSYFSPMEPLIAQLKIGLVLAIVATFPYCVWQVWRFLAPALYEHERDALKRAVFASAALFLAGAAFCLMLIVPAMMRFSVGFSSETLQPVIGLANFLDIAGWMTLAFGLMFQFPLCVLLAVRFGLTTPESLAHKRPYVIVVILILAAVFTPPDLFSQVALATPTWLLFELGLFFSRRVKPRKNESIEEAPETDVVAIASGEDDEPHPPQEETLHPDDSFDFYENEYKR